jgi:hypothetical protein
MKKLIKLVSLSLIAFLFFGSNQSFAQQKGNRPNAAFGALKEKSDSLKIKLKLTDFQSAKFDEIMKRNREEIRKRMMELPDDASRMERAEVMRETIKNADKEILEILDSDQQIVYRSEKEKMQQERKSNRKRTTKNE